MSIIIKMVVSFFKKHHGRSGAKIDASREEQSKIIIDLQTQNSVLNSQVATLQKELIDASQKNKILANDKWILGQEKVQLIEQLKQVTRSFATQEKINT